MATQRRSVYPVAGRWIPGIPAVPVITEPEVARRLVRTGAFTRDSRGLEHPDSVELDDDQIAALDRYDNVPAEEPEPDHEDGREAGATSTTRAESTPETPSVSRVTNPPSPATEAKDKPAAG